MFAVKNEIRKTTNTIHVADTKLESEPCWEYQLGKCSNTRQNHTDPFNQWCVLTIFCSFTTFLHFKSFLVFRNRYLLLTEVRLSSSCSPRVSVQGVESLWGDCRFIPADWGS